MKLILILLGTTNFIGYLPSSFHPYNFFFYCGKIYIKATTLSVSKWTVQGPSSIHIVVQPPALSVSRTFSASQTQTLHPLTPHSPLIPAPGNLILLSVSVNLTILGISHKWTHTIFALCLEYVTEYIFKGHQC